MRTIKNPKRLWREIRETVSPEARNEKAREAKSRAEAKLADLKREEEGARRALAGLAGHPGQDPEARAEVRRLEKLALGLLLADLPVQFFLNRAAFPGLSTWLVAALAPGIALALAFFAHGGAMALFHDRERPARGIRRCSWMARGSFLAAVLAFGLFVFARQATAEMAEYLLTLTAVSLWVLAEALPISAGLFSAWARMLERPLKEEARLRQLEAEIAAWLDLLDRLGAEDGKSAESSPEDSRQGDLFRGPQAAAARPGTVTLAVALLAALVGLTEPAEGQEAAAEGRTCAIMVDRTLSMDPVHRERAIGLLREALPALPYELGCGALIAGTFADEGPWAPRVWLDVPMRPAERDCAKVEAPAQTGATGVLVAMRGFRESLKKKAQEACRREEEAARRRFERERQAFVAAAWAALGGPQLEQETRTDIVGVLESLLDSGVETALIVTDGIDTAGREIAKAHAQGVYVALILVPARDKFGGRKATDQAARGWEAVGSTLPYTTLVSPLVRAELKLKITDQ